MKTFIHANEASAHTDNLITNLTPESCYKIAEETGWDVSRIPIPANISGWYFKDTNEFCGIVYRRAFILLAINHIVNLKSETK